VECIAREAFQIAHQADSFLASRRQFDSIQLKLMSNEDSAGADPHENSSRAIIYKEYFEFLRGCGTEEQFFFKLSKSTK
jgi:hypothetical protein